MASDGKPARADEDDYFLARDARLGAARATTCATCQAPLPEGHRYLCAVCVADSETRAAALLAALAAPAAGTTAAPAIDAAPAASAGSAITPTMFPERGDADEDADCPQCGGPLDPSGRCAQCVI